MIFKIEPDQEAPTPVTLEEMEADPASDHLLVLDFEEVERLAEPLGLEEKPLNECLKGGSTKYESQDGFDYMSVNIPDDRNLLRNGKRICIYFRKGMLLFACKDRQVADKLIEAIRQDGGKNETPQRVLYAFFDKLTGDDSYLLDNIEKEIDSLEEGLITSKKKDCVKDIVRLRKKLMRLKKYYEQMLVITETILENENGLFDSGALKYFRMLERRINRLYGSVQYLRDNVTQVREAYQAQVDIELNQLMKLFTVITTIFLPLTLITGWYGMNLNLPEYGWEWGYPFVIGLSVSVIATCVVYFKRNDWF